MPTVRVIACLDCENGRVVAKERFLDARDAGDPTRLARAYEDDGADELVLLDADATAHGTEVALAKVRQVREQLSIPLTVGGGVAHTDDVAALLDAGADKVSVDTLALARPQLIADIATRHGSQCAVLTLDAAARADGSGWDVMVRAGKHRTQQDVVMWARHAVDLGIGEILLTSHEQHGTMRGYDLALIRAVTEAVGVPVIAAGGAASAAHMHAALEAGADAVLAAKLFHDGHATVQAVKDELQGLGHWMRPPHKQY